MDVKISRDAYRNIPEESSGRHLFNQAWWLDAVCGEDGWDAVVAENGGKPVGAWAYRPILGGRVVNMPPLTQSMGPWIAYPAGQKPARRLGWEKDILSALADALPKSFFFVQNAPRSFTNWLPLFWKGFRQTTRYTYVLEDLSNISEIEAGFLDKTRNEIRKAEKSLTVEESDDIPLLYRLVGGTFQRQKSRVPYDLGLLERIDAACAAHSARRMLVARDSEGRAHAAVYIIRDETTAYYLIGGGDPNLRSSSATSLLIREAIRRSAGEVREFDFEGSMMESVERFFRSFGAIQKPYFNLSRAGKLARVLKELKG